MKNQGKNMIDYKAILGSQEAIEFRQALTGYGMYCRSGSTPPYSVEKIYKECLQRYRAFLDDHGLYMKPAKKKAVFNDE